MHKKLIVIGLLIIGLTSSTSAQRIEANVQKIDKRLYYIKVEGTPYERGFQHGQALKYVIQSGIANWKQWIREVLEQNNPEIEIAEFIHGTDYMNSILKHTPKLYEELQGISIGANVNFNDLFAYNIFDEFVAFTVEKYRLSFCTGFGVYGRKDLPNIIGQNNDLPRYFDGSQTIMHIIEKDGKEILVFTFAGLLANNGMNNRGLGCTINIMPAHLSGDFGGLPMPYIVRGILNKDSREEAIEFLKGIKRYAGPMNYIVGDKTGVSSIETGKDFFKVHSNYNGENYVPHTNHPLDSTGIVESGKIAKSLERFEKLNELIIDHVDEIEVEEAKKIFRTYPILKNYQTDPTFPTLESIIMELDPNNLKLYIAPGPPDMYKYSTFDFSHGFIGTEK